MTTFSRAGEAMLLAQEGNHQLARAVAAAFRRWFAPVKAWLADMPTSLPPTESGR